MFFLTVNCKPQTISSACPFDVMPTFSQQPCAHHQLLDGFPVGFFVERQPTVVLRLAAWCLPGNSQSFERQPVDTQPKKEETTGLFQWFKRSTIWFFDLVVTCCNFAAGLKDSLAFFHSPSSPKQKHSRPSKCCLMSQKMQKRAPMVRWNSSAPERFAEVLITKLWSWCPGLDLRGCIFSSVARIQFVCSPSINLQYRYV